MTDGGMAPALTRLALALVFYRYAILKRPPHAGGQISPVGAARLLDLSVLGLAPVHRWLSGVAVVCLVAYVLGQAQALALTYLCGYLLLYETLENSHGAIAHRKQLLCLVFLTQAAGALCPAYGPTASFSWAQQAVVSVYFTAGLTKIGKSGRRWIDTCPWIALQMIKGAKQYHCARGRFAGMEEKRAVANWLLANPGLTRAIVSMGLLLELCSPLFLISRPAALIGGIALLGFHAVVWQFMRINFVCNGCLVAIFLVDVPSILSGL